MQKNLMLATTSLLLALNAIDGSAGTFSGGEWKSTACGTEPVATPTDMSTRQAFNNSVVSTQAYLLAMRDYLNCAITESNADATAITRLMAEKIKVLEEQKQKFLDDAAAAQLRFQQSAQ